MRTYAGMVVESHEIVRCGLADLMRETPSIDHVSAYRTLAAARTELSERPPNVLVVSSRLSKPSVEELLELTINRSTWVLVLVAGVDPSQVMAAARIPAQGFLSEPDLTVEYLTMAMEQIEQGGTPMPASVARQLIELASAGRPRRVPDLTLRECTVLKFMAEGLSNKEIARELSISQHGVKRHVANILAKLNCPNRTLAVMTAIREGMLPPPVTPTVNSLAVSRAG